MRAEAAWKIRRAVRSDAPALSALARWVWLQTYALDGLRDSFIRYLDDSFSEARLHALIADPAQPMWLLHEGNHLLAWAHVELGAAWAGSGLAVGGAQAELQRLYVAPTRSGEGFGARLLQHVREALPAHAVWLRAWAGNEGALRFYRREGAQQLGETWFELEQERHRNEVLGWPAWEGAQ
ncbi:GNAT family N-acetyltransferase [Paucibacter sp. APW11]|uniref:GNAT family N-acetyltransferase n=1 Tax=Roseateles aquae TaxID=3077235 RepID=A0ABU3PH09_9BURK|nr:GNAT family N-acetyltransferase [Paucibacter sp. APW11]MDT9001291.1 GNAT family N-acetyltransferase [Paucibacter sp. APW11]